MFDLGKMVVDGLLLALATSLFVLGILYFRPRLFLQDYPEDIQQAVPPKTKEEERLSWIVGFPMLVLMLAAGVVFCFNLVDWLVLDWLVFCTLTPSFLVIPGTEGLAGYKDYGFHFRGFLVGTALSSVGGLIIGTICYLV
jgi:hypothetical protein